MSFPPAGPPGRPLRIANCSGFYGDRLSAAKEMVFGGPIDVLTGDWLAELTMYVLHRTLERGGYATTFLRQMADVLPACLERGIRIVSNAGGLRPEACAQAVRSLAAHLGVSPHVATVTGDDIAPRLQDLRALGESFSNLETGQPLPEDAPVVTANAYLGGAPIAAALLAGADVVVTGRVTDASLVVGPGIAAFGWGPHDLDALAGAVVAGHAVECGAQCTGGNYAFFDEVPGISRCGFPLVELHSDGSSVVTKHPGTGGLVSVGTLTAQLLYEIDGPRYLSPDAVARFDTIALQPDGPDRVRISQVRGEPPPDTYKVAAHLQGGWRNSMTLVLTGAQLDHKAEVAQAAVWEAVPGGRAAFTQTSVELLGPSAPQQPAPGPPAPSDRAPSGPDIETAFLRISVAGDDRDQVGRGFSSAVVETILASYPGAYLTSPPTGATEMARFWPTLVAVDQVPAVVNVEGRPVALPEAWSRPRPAARSPRPDLSETPGPPRWPGAAVSTSGRAPSPPPEGPGRAPGPPPEGPGRAPGTAPGPREGTVRIPLGILVGARSGDKGGNANVGLWADDDEVARWLLGYFDVEAFRGVLPEAGGLVVERYTLPNLGAVNFVVRGFLGSGVAANLRADGQAKGTAELVRSRPVMVPAALARRPGPARRAERWASPVLRPGAL